MARILSLIFILCIALGSTTLSAACDPTSTDAAGFLTACAASTTNAVDPSSFQGGKEGTLKLVIQVSERVLQFGALFAIGAIVFSGIRYTTSAGDDEKLKSAKNTAIYALIGLILLLVAFPMVDIVIRFVYSLGT
ncbi:MAG: hypothetical protein WAW59_08150 [Patescibacteria group bacterium]